MFCSIAHNVFVPFFGMFSLINLNYLNIVIVIVKKLDVHVVEENGKERVGQDSKKNSKRQAPVF